jgi:hypothetical protein
LLIFLTPYVMQTPGDLVRLSAEEGMSMEMAPKVFSEQELQKYLDTLPVKPAKPDPAPAPAKAAPKSKK